MGSLSRTWEMMRASWTVLKKDTELLVFPALSSIAVVLVVASFAVPLFEGGGMSFSQIGDGGPLTYVLLFLFYVVTSFVMIFFNAALVGCALARMTGDDPTVRFGLRLAWRRLPQIFLWALATSTVGFFLRVVEEWVGIGGKIITSILGMAWSVTSYLVVPVLVHKAVDPVEAYKESVSMLKKTWGAQITGTISFSLLFAVLSIPPLALLVAISLQGSLVAVGTAMAIAAVYLVLLFLVQATLQSIFQAAVYAYAYAGEVPPGFDERTLSASFRRK
jgi:hypothetical protein